MRQNDERLNLDGAVWIDVNTLITVNGLPDRLPDELAIEGCSLLNLFNCPIGARGPLFEPTFGSMLYHFLQEPPGQQTAESIQVNLIQAIRTWEPRIDLNYGGTRVLFIPTLPGYRITLNYTLRLTNDPKTVEFSVKLPGH